MYDISRHPLPLMAGSSVPLAQRRPVLEVPGGSEFEEAVAIHGGARGSLRFPRPGDLAIPGVIAAGGETGVASVEFLAGDALFRAAQQGRWSLRLAEAAMAVEFGKNAPDMRGPIPRERPLEPHGLLLTYRDGFRATVLKVGQHHWRWNIAYKLAATTGTTPPASTSALTATAVCSWRRRMPSRTTS